MMEVSIRCSCREKVKIPLVPCECIFSLIMFTGNNLDNFQTDFVVHRINTRAKHQLHWHTVKFSCTQKGFFYSSIKTLNILPLHILKWKQKKPKFKVASWQYHTALTFYSLNVFLSTSQIAFPLQHQWCKQQV
jgi:hypothetical protein